MKKNILLFLSPLFLTSSLALTASVSCSESNTVLLEWHLGEDFKQVVKSKPAGVLGDNISATNIYLNDVKQNLYILAQDYMYHFITNREFCTDQESSFSFYGPYFYIAQSYYFSVKVTCEDSTNNVFSIEMVSKHKNSLFSTANEWIETTISFINTPLQIVSLPPKDYWTFANDYSFVVIPLYWTEEGAFNISAAIDHNWSFNIIHKNLTDGKIINDYYYNYTNYDMLQQDMIIPWQVYSFYMQPIKPLVE